QASGGVEDEDVDAAGPGGLAGVEGDGRGVAALLPLDDLDAEALAPDLELADGAGAEGVAGAEEDLLVLVAERLAELGDAGGLAGAVDAGDEDNGRLLGGEVERAVALGPHGLELAFEVVEDLLAPGHPAGLVVGADALDEAGGRLHADVGLDQAALEVGDEGVVELPAAQHGAQAADERLAGLLQPGLELVEDFLEE